MATTAATTTRPATTSTRNTSTATTRAPAVTSAATTRPTTTAAPATTVAATTAPATTRAQAAAAPPTTSAGPSAGFGPVAPAGSGRKVNRGQIALDFVLALLIGAAATVFRAWRTGSLALPFRRSRAAA